MLWEAESEAAEISLERLRALIRANPDRLSGCDADHKVSYSMRCLRCLRKTDPSA